MFSGIVEAIGTVEQVQSSDGLMSVQLHAPEIVPDAESLKIGDSVNVSGACLTVTQIERPTFCVDITLETLRRTTLANLHVGSQVNLERALRYGDRVGGHLVQGHVDGMATVTRLTSEGAALLVRVEAPTDIIAYTIEKGFVALDGVSLTCFDRDASGFDFTLIPHTAAVTTLGMLDVGTQLNIEVDMAAKYLEQFTSTKSNDESPSRN